MIVEAHSDFDALGPAYDGWMAMAEAAPRGSIFLTPLWSRTWWRHYGGGRPLAILTARSAEGDLVGVAPFFGDGESLALVGSDDLLDYRDILTRPGFEEAVIDGFLSHLEAEVPGWSSVVLNSVPEESGAIRILEGMARERGLTFAIEKEDDCPVLDLPPSWEDFLGGLGSKYRHEIRRKTRKAFKGEDVSVAWIRDRDDLGAALESFVHLHALSSPTKADFMARGRRRFFEDLVVAFQELGMLKLCFLQQGDKRLAALLCFDHASTRFAYNSGYDPEYASLSPGIVLFAESIRNAIEEGCGRFDLLRGTETYKRRLGATARPIHRIVLERTH